MLCLLVAVSSLLHLADSQDDGEVATAPPPPSVEERQVKSGDSTVLPCRTKPEWWQMNNYGTTSKTVHKNVN